MQANRLTRGEARRRADLRDDFQRQAEPDEAQVGHVFGG